MLKSQKKKKGPKQVSANQWVSLATAPRNAPTSVRRLAVVYSNNSLSAGAALAGIISASGVSAANDWTTLQSLYQECRILGMKITFVPEGQATSAAVLTDNGAMIVATDRTAASPVPPTATVIAAFQNPKIFPFKCFNKAYTYEVKSVDLEDQQFTATSSAPNPYRVYMWYQASGVASTTHTVAGITNTVWLVEWVVEFKGAL